jgi:PPOX class probable F420-dependent enzyme
MPTSPFPPALREMLAQPNAAVMATVRKDGQPVSVATWYLLDGDRFLISLDATRTRLAHLRRDPRLSLTVLDSDWYTHVSIQGRVTELRDDLDLVDIDRISSHYQGQPYTNRTDPRVSVYFEVERWAGWNTTAKTE